MKTVHEYHKELLTKLNLGLDISDGSTLSILLGAFAQQCATMDANNRMAKLQDHPAWNDIESLGLEGRKIGLYPFKESSSIFELETSTVLEAGAIITSDDRSYAVTQVMGNNRYEITSEKAGADTAAIPPAWFTTFEFKTSVSGETYTGKIVRKLALGRDREDTDAFRYRVLMAHMTRPFNANPQFVRTYLMDKCAGVGCVRIAVTQYLVSTSHVLVSIYLGDYDLDAATDYTVGLARTALSEFMPIGTEYTVGKVTRLVNSANLKFTVTYTNQQSALPTEAKNSVIKALQDELIRTTQNTFPIDKITLDTPALQGVVSQVLEGQATNVQLTIEYNGTERNPVILDADKTPWANEANVVFNANGNQQINYVPDVV